MLVLLIGLIFVHQMLEYLGQMAMWHWWGDLVPEKERGAFFGKRQGLQLAFALPCGLLLSYFVDYMRDGNVPGYGAQHAYAIAHSIGAMLLLCSIVPASLLSAPAPSDLIFAELNTSGEAAVIQKNDSQLNSVNALSAAFKDQSFWRFLLFRTWFSFANGITQSVQFIYTANVLSLGVFAQTVFRMVMQIGQLILSFSIGSYCDRWGYRRMLIIAQTVVTLGLGVYLFIQPQLGISKWWLVLAWLLWSAYAVHNLAFPNIALAFAPREFRSGYLASHEAAGSFARYAWRRS